MGITVKRGKSGRWLKQAKQFKLVKLAKQVNRSIGNNVKICKTGMQVCRYAGIFFGKGHQEMFDLTNFRLVLGVCNVHVVIFI